MFFFQLSLFKIFQYSVFYSNVDMQINPISGDLGQIRRTQEASAKLRWMSLFCSQLQTKLVSLVFCQCCRHKSIFRIQTEIAKKLDQKAQVQLTNELIRIISKVYLKLHYHYCELLNEYLQEFCYLCTLQVKRDFCQQKVKLK